MTDERVERLHGLDHLRALAILLVLLFHYEIYYGLPVSLAPSGLLALGRFGWTGVDLFFVLSGYLIGDKLMGDVDRFGQVRFGRFYLNRALRILPAYLAAVTIYFSFAGLQEGRGLQPLWRFLTFTQNLLIDVFTNTFSHAWSLCVEEHFYLLLPALLSLLVARKLQHRAVLFLLGLFAFGLAVRYLSWSELVDPVAGRDRLRAAFTFLYYPTYARLDGLAVGVGIAALFRYRPAVRDRLAGHGNLLLLAGLAVLVGCYLLFGGNIVSMTFTTPAPPVFGFPLLALGYGLLVAGALCPGCLLYRLRCRPTAALATLSYAVYLVHKMTNHWLNVNLRDYVEVGEDQLFLICLIAALLGGLALHLVIERPFLLLRDRLR